MEDNDISHIVSDKYIENKKGNIWKKTEQFSQFEKITFSLNITQEKKTMYGRNLYHYQKIGLNFKIIVTTLIRERMELEC